MAAGPVHVVVVEIQGKFHSFKWQKSKTSDKCHMVEGGWESVQPHWKIVQYIISYSLRPSNPTPGYTSETHASMNVLGQVQECSKQFCL